MFRHNGNSKFFNRNRCEFSFSFKLQGRDFGEHVKSDQGSFAIAFGLTHLVELQRFVFHECHTVPMMVDWTVTCTSNTELWLSAHGKL